MPVQYTPTSKMSLADKIQALTDTFGPSAIRYGYRADWHPHYSASLSDPVQGHWTFKEKCPPYLSYSEVHSYPEENVRIFIDLGSIGRGEDTADQASTIDRSNYRSLRRDYPDTFTDISYGNVDVLGAFIGNLSAELISVLCGLHSDYPLYDESDLDELESEEISESWDQYVQSDLTSEIYRAHADEGDSWDALTPDQQSEMFWAAVEATDSYPEHNHHEVCWKYDAIISELADRLNVLPAMTS